MSHKKIKVITKLKNISVFRNKLQKNAPASIRINAENNSKEVLWGRKNVFLTVF